MEGSNEKLDTMSVDSNLKPIPRERAFLETFFYTLAQFQFDRAHDLSEKEKERFKPSPGSAWMGLLSSLTAFASLEKSYFAMIFIERRSNILGRRETAKSLYLNLSTELKKQYLLHNSLTKSQVEDPVDEAEVLSTDLLKQLHQFLQARLKMMELYEFIAKSGWSHLFNTEQLIQQLEDLNQEHSKEFHHPILDPLKTSFTYELDVVLTLFKTKLSLSEWEFFDSLLSLKDIQAKLQAWGMLSPSHKVKEQLMSSFSYKSFFGKVNKKQSEIPFLYNWLYQFYESLLSKFTLYFYLTLSSQAPTTDTKANCSRTSIDFIAKLHNFQKKTDTINISLVLDASSKRNIFRGHGYHLDTTIREKPTGMSSFPSVVSIPETKPKEHWPNIITIITDRAHDLNSADKVIYFYDAKLDSSYFLIKVDIRMTLVLIYGSKKKERDSYIQNFLTDIRSLLQHDNLYAMLKPGQGKVFEKVKQ